MGRHILGLTLDERIAQYISKQTNGCWLWTKTLCPNGYARIVVKGKNLRVHRILYEKHRGIIPEGLVSDHLCRVRNCVNPWHLELVSNKVNVLRGVGITAINATKTHCIRGHEFSDDNVYLTPDGYRYCKTCHRDDERKKSRLRRGCDPYSGMAVSATVQESSK